MSVALIHYYEGGTQEQYEATRAAVHPDGGLPAGQTHHFAGPTENGYKVIAIWDSQESLDTFVANVLRPALADLEGGFGGPPTEHRFEVAKAQTA